MCFQSQCTQRTPKSQSMPFDFGVRKIHCKGKNCLIASVFLLENEENSKRLFVFGVQNHTLKRGFGLSSAMPFDTPLQDFPLLLRALGATRRLHYWRS